ncbi:MAG: hypothetical protein HYV29_04040 [Ignavibacteriales bacterium]|nr:hypothetical protein [Ignavibacteriales bacterium]
MQHILRSVGMRMTSFLMLLALLPFSFNCVKSPLEPKAPSWKTQLTIPLVDKTFYFADVIRKDSKFDTTGATILYRPITEGLGYRKGLPPEVFKMASPRGNTIDQQIGAIPVDIGVPPSFNLTSSDLGINSANFNPSFPPQSATLTPAQLGMPTGVPLPADIPSIPIDQDFGDTTEFTYLVFANGTISLQITNNFPFAIQFAGNQLWLVNFNTAAETSQTVAQFNFTGQIASNSTATSAPVPLAGVKMDGIQKLKGTMSTSGATGQTLQSSNTLAAQVSFASTQIQSMVPDPAPPFALNQIFGDSTNFLYIVFETGQMSMTITNNFPFTITFAGNALQLVNKKDTTQTVATFNFPGSINPNTSATSSTASLTDVQMDAILKLKGTVVISNYFGKTVSGTDNITATVNLTNGKLQSALVNTLNFNPTNVLEVPDSSVKLDDSIKVKLARFDSGAVRIRIVNNNAVKLSVKFSISELRDNKNNGEEFRLQGTNPVTGILTINGKDSTNELIQMKDVTFVSRDRQGSDTVVTRFLHFKLEIKTLQANAQEYALVSKTDNVIADVQPTGSFVLDEVQGKIPPRKIDITQSFDAGIGDIGNNLSLDGFRSAISLAVNVLSTGLFPTDVNLDIYPANKNGIEGTPVNITRRINPGDPSVIAIDSSQVNSLMNSFLATSQELPSKFNLRGFVMVSPLDIYNDTTTATAGIGRVVQEDSVFVNMDYAIPIAIGIQNAVLKDTVSISANVPDTSQINLIEEGRVFFDLTSTFPLAIEVRTKLLKADPSDSTKASLTDPPVLVLDTLSVDGSVDHTNKNSFTFMSLSGEEAAKLNQASFTAIDLNFATTINNGTVPVVFNRTDSLVLRSSANIRFNVDLDRLK